jgi:hypothetical protein
MAYANGCQSRERLLGYSLTFGTGSRWLGDLSHVLMRGLGLEAQGEIPE